MYVYIYIYIYIYIYKAEQTFHDAVAKDETDVRALYGIIHCRVQEGNLDDAEEQLEFLSEIQAFRERGSAPKRGRRSTMFFSTKCICAVAA